MFGQNPIRKPLNSDGSCLEIQEIFETIQGEGPFVGIPAVFIRLGGCNLACTFCDTEFESFSTMSVEEILAITLTFKHKLIVITGGEPMRQPIEFLCNKLLDIGKIIQIETNGLIYRKLPTAVKIICSPKTMSGKYIGIRQDLLQNVSALKFLISANILEYSSIPELGQKEFGIETFLQPMDEFNKERNKQNLDLAISLSLQNGCRLSLQIHKIAGIR